MKIVCISDTHNQQRNVMLPPGDVLVHAGDMTNHGTPVEIYQVALWIDKHRKNYKSVVITPGNHDILFEKDEIWAREYFSGMKNVHVLINQEVVIDGMRFWGSPWTKRFFNWAFNSDDLQSHWGMIPSDTDVLVTHEPPLGIGDFIEYQDLPGLPRSKEREHLGCSLLKKKVEELQPRLHIYGHIHGGAGTRRLGRTIMVNAAQLDDRYQHVHEPIVVEI